MGNDLFAECTEEEKIAIFREYFDRDLESYFSSRILCCGRCVGEYNALWPGTFAHDVRLQTQRLATTYFLQNSRVRDVFSQDDIDRYVRELFCPNCDGPLDGGEFWIYEHEFDLPEDFQTSVEEIAKLAAKSPFLLLTHKFAKEVFDTIVTIGATVESQSISATCFRARRADKLPSPGLNDFAPPPAQFVEEGRYNHAGHSMLYMATDEGTALAEIASTKYCYHVAELAIQAKWRVLDLTVKEAYSPRESLLQCLARSSLCAAPRTGEGWVRPEYVFTRFVADCARYAEIDMIKYGSTKNQSGQNWVALNPPLEISSMASLCRIRTS